MLLKLEPRPEASVRMKYLAPIISFCLTLIGGILLFSLLGKNPWEAFRVFFLNPLSSTYNISELLLKATPLMLIAVGLSVGFKASIWNIGAEGQYILGAIFATGLAIHLPEDTSPFIFLPSLAVAGALGGALWGAIPAFCRTRFNANEILVSLMLVYVANLFASWLVYNPWRDPEGYGFPQTKIFPDNALLPVLVEGTRLNYAFVGALAVLIVGYVFMYRSYVGFQLKVAGQAHAAARYAGFSANFMVWLGLLSGGACAGLAGMTEVAGSAAQLTEHISSNYGFAAIIVAFIGRLHPFGILLSSLLMALIYIGGEQVQHYLALPPSIGMVFQGMLLFFLLGSDLFIHFRIRVRKLGVGSSV